MSKNNRFDRFSKTLRYFLIMKLTITLLVAGVFQVSAFTYAQRINLKVKNVPLEKVLLSIQAQSGYSFLFRAEYAEIAKAVTLDVKDKEVKDVLPLVLANQPFDYLLKGTVVTLLPKEPDISVSVRAVQKELYGRVIDSVGDPIAGVSLVIKGTSRGTVTDSKGWFSLLVNPGEIVRVTYVGFLELEIAVADQTSLEIVLRAAESDLDEVVVVAYGKQRKESVIGAITTISPNNLRMPVSKISTSLAGQVAGIVSVRGNGEPGMGASFWIRGVSTFGANSRPLVLIDGIERPLDLVDPEDVESFSILKDATATAVYGVRGANGIVLVTTKRGRITDKPTINARYERGQLSPVRMVKLADAGQWMDYYNEISAEGSMNVPFPQHVKDLYLNHTDPDLYPNVDWMDAIFKDATTSNRMTVNITGGGKVAKYYVSGSYLDENGLFEPVTTPNYNPQIKYGRYNFRSNVDLNVSTSTVVSLNLSNQYERRNRLGVDMVDMYRWLISTPPISIPLEYSDGTHAMPLVGFNPYYSLNSTGFSHDFWNTAQSLITLNQDFSKLVTPGLSAMARFSWDAVNESTLDKRKRPSTFFATGRDAEGNLFFHRISEGSDYLSLGRSNRGSRTTNFETSLNYDRMFADRHRVGGMFLFSMREHTNNFPGDFIAAFPFRNTGIASRFTYSFDDRYFIEGNFGYNGSENFAPGKRFGFFPSVAAGYIMSNETYFRPLAGIVSLLKVRGSVGEIGNDQIGGNRRFAYNSEMTSANGYQFGVTGQRGVGGVATGHPGNPNVAWESAIKRNVGIELGLFNKLTVIADYFSDKRDGIYILQQSVPSIVGVNVAQYVNLGKMENRGADASLEYTHTVGDFAIQGRGNFTYNRNKVIYNDRPTPIWAYQSYENKRHGQIGGLIAEGLFASEEEIANHPVQMFGEVRPGDIKYRDVNGDGQVDSFDEVGIGYSSIPEINYGFGFSVGWKGLDLSVLFHGVDNVSRRIHGDAIYGSTGNILVEGQIYADVAEKRWTPNNPDPNAEYARLSLKFNENNIQSSTFYLRDMSFLRLKNTELGYSFPKHWFDRAGFSSVRLYAQGFNLLTFSKFKLWDPELDISTGQAYPQMKVVNVGLNVIL